jgi:hypothetical protein
MAIRRIVKMKPSAFLNDSHNVFHYGFGNLVATKSRVNDANLFLIQENVSSGSGNVVATDFALSASTSAA